MKYLCQDYHKLPLFCQVHFCFVKSCFAVHSDDQIIQKTISRYGFIILFCYILLQLRDPEPVAFSITNAYAYERGPVFVPAYVREHLSVI
jgi:hypothetical protein